MSAVLYLAYGSNLFAPRLLARAPRARAVGQLALKDWDLRFHKRSWRDGSAKCDIVRDAGSTVHAAVYDLGEDGRGGLDAAEGLGNGYREMRLTASLAGRELPVFTYVAQPSHVDSSLLPFSWYRDLVLAGARRHGFPPAYVDRLASVPTVEDPDRERAARACRLLAAAAEGIRRSSTRP